MSFSDIMQGIQFFSGLTQGFGKRLEDERKNQEHSNLQLLSFLNKDGTHSIEQLDPEDIDTTGSGLFGQNAAKTKDGLPAFKVGGSYFTARKRPALDMEKLFGGTEPAPTPSESMPITQTPLQVPSTSPTPQAAQPVPAQAAIKRATPVQLALDAYQKLDPKLKARYDAAIPAAAEKYGHTPEELYAQIGIESKFNPNAQSPRGALGPSQFMPNTAARYGLKDPTNIEASVDAQARYLRDLKRMFPGDDKQAYAGYNAGEGAVQQHGGIPPYPETQNYVKNVLGARGEFRKLLTGQPASTMPDTSMQVAGDAAPSPVLPKEITLPAASTEHQFLQAYIKKNLPLVAPGGELLDTPETRKMLHTLGQEAHRQFIQQREDIDAKVKEDAKHIHDPALIQLLKSGRIKTPEQWAAYEALKAQLPDDTQLRDTTSRLMKAARANNDVIPRQAVADEYQRLRNLNWSEPDIKHAINASGYDVQEEQEKLSSKKDTELAAKKKEGQELAATGARPLDAKAMSDFKLPSFQAGTPEERSAIMKAVAKDKQDALDKAAANKAEVDTKKMLAKAQQSSQAALAALDQLDKLQKKIFTVPGGGVSSLAARAKQAVTVETEKATQPGEGTVSTYEGASLAHILTIAKALTGTGRMAYSEVLQLQQGLPKLHGAYGILPDSKRVAQNKIDLMRQLIERAIKRPPNSYPAFDVGHDPKTGAITQIPIEGGTPTPAGTTPTADILDELKELVPSGGTER